MRVYISGRTRVHMLQLLDRCSTSGGEPEDACMKLVMLSLMSSLAEAMKDLLQTMSYWHERNTKDSYNA